MATRRFGPYSFEVSNLDKAFFPGDGLTKRDLMEYYEAVADAMVPHLDGRPLTMHRFPDGIEGEGFYQKDTPDYFPDWIERVRVKKEGGEVTHVVCGNRATLSYLASQGCITPHVWLSRRDRIRKPDLMIFDLDPSGGDFEPVRRAAFALRDLLDGVGLAAFVKTTGSRGLHVAVPLDRSSGFDRVRGFARELAERLVAAGPAERTLEQRKDKRGDRVFVDVLRNAYAQTAVAPYAVRARPGAPVSAPLDWDELEDREIGPRSFTVGDIPRRLGQEPDPWRGMRRRARGLERARRRLEQLPASD